MTAAADRGVWPVVSSFCPVQQLYEAGKQVLETAAVDAAHRSVLEEALRQLEEAAEASEPLMAVREAVRQLYSVPHSADAGVEIDDANFIEHNGMSGYWVGAWLWVPDAEVR